MLNEVILCAHDDESFDELKTLMGRKRTHTKAKANSVDDSVDSRISINSGTIASNFLGGKGRDHRVSILLTDPVLFDAFIDRTTKITIFRASGDIGNFSISTTAQRQQFDDVCALMRTLMLLTGGPYVLLRSYWIRILLRRFYDNPKAAPLDGTHLPILISSAPCRCWPRTVSDVLTLWMPYHLPGVVVSQSGLACIRIPNHEQRMIRYIVDGSPMCNRCIRSYGLMAIFNRAIALVPIEVMFNWRLTNDPAERSYNDDLFSSWKLFFQVPSISFDDIAKADIARVALIKSPLYKDDVDTSEALKRYFAIPRLVRVNDVIRIENPRFSPLSLADEQKKSPRELFFRVMYLSTKGSQTAAADDDSDYIIDSSFTSLYQVASVSGTIPQLLSLSSEPGDLEVTISRGMSRPTAGISPGLRPYVDELCHCCRSFTRLLRTHASKQNYRGTHPLCVLIAGGIGAGKTSVVKLAAQMLCWHLFQVDCYDLWSETPASTETKISSILQRGSNYAPVIILMKNVEAVGKDAQTGQINSRVVSHLRETIRCLPSSPRDWPLVIVGTSSDRSNIGADLLTLFAMNLEIKAFDEQTRFKILEWLLQTQIDHLDAPFLRKLSQKTAGFLMADFYKLIDEAMISTYNRCNKVSDLEGDETVAEAMLKPTDFDAALEQMQKHLSSAIGAPKIPQVTWEDIGGLTDIKREIIDTIQLGLDHPVLFAGELRRSGLLLYGPPGCGKTMLAKAVATECSLNFLSVKGPELLNMYVGQSEQNIREVFEKARSASPCVIFFDELDSLAPNRGRSGDSGGVMDRVVSQLLAELDGIDSNDQSDIFVIGATNRPDLIDSSLLRPGRFDKVLYVGINEDDDSKLRILQACCRKLTLNSDVSLQCLIPHLPRGLTGADISALVKGAVLNAMSRILAEAGGDNEAFDESSVPIIIRHQDFEAAVNSLTPSVSREELKRYEAFQHTLKG